MDNVARVREAWRAWAASYEDRMVRLPTVQLGTLTMSSRAVHVARTVRSTVSVSSSREPTSETRGQWRCTCCVVYA